MSKINPIMVMIEMQRRGQSMAPERTISTGSAGGSR
jgi:hypothetical protein